MLEGGDGGVLGGIGGTDVEEALGELGELVAVAHPDLELLGEAVEESVGAGLLVA